MSSQERMAEVWEQMQAQREGAVLGTSHTRRCHPSTRLSPSHQPQEVHRGGQVHL